MEHITLEEYKQLQQKGNSKYKAKKTSVDGHSFDSQKEANRYLELKMLEKQGLIKELELQPKFILQETFKYNNKIIKKICYYADFKYYDLNTRQVIVEDVKSEITKKDKVYILKKKIFLKKYGALYCFREVD